MNRVSLMKSELINGDANGRTSEIQVTLKYRISRREERGEEGRGEGPKQKLR